MMDLFAPPRLFSLFAVAADGDDDLKDGSHIRLLPSPLLGFPIAPFGLWNVGLWIDREREILRLPESGEGERVWIAPPADGNTYDIGVEVLPEAFDARVTLLDGTGRRTVAQRSGYPWYLGAPQPRRLFVRGGGSLEAVNILCASAGNALEEILGREPDELLALPIDDRLPWYAGGKGRVPAFERVKGAAPNRLTPLDRPNGDFEEVPEGDEELRLRVLAEEPGAGIDRSLLSLLGEHEPPWDRRLVDTRDATEGMPWQKVDVALQNALLMQAMDPGVARYLGFMTRRETPTPDFPSAWAAVGVFAVDPSRPIGARRRLGDVLGRPGPFEQRIIEAFSNHVPDLSDLVGKIIGGAEGRTKEIRAFVTVGAAVPPADRPEMTRPMLGPTRWLPAIGPTPSMAFRQDFTFADLPFGVITAMSRLEDTGYAPREEKVTLGPAAKFPDRRVPLLIGTLQYPQPAGAGGVVVSGLATDGPIPVRDNSWLYQFHLSDLFGRFGDGVEIEVPTPARQRPPTPAVQIEIERNPPSHGSFGALSPGKVIARAPVPAIETLAAGSLDIRTFEVSVDGVTLVAATATAGDVAAVEVPLRPIGPSETLRIILTARFYDSSGAASPLPDWAEAIEVTDGRRPEVISTALGIVWTSRPGPAPEVELKLAWQPRRSGEAYRAYLADARGLGIDGATRAAVARTAGERQRTGQLAGEQFRKRFRLLTDPPLTAGADGRVHLDERLPRSLETVQILRVVPLTGAGIEADFDGCGIIPVAVPTDRRPPPPRLTVATLPGASAATLGIEAVGLDLAELKLAEPDLFVDPPAGPPPQYRLRRAAGQLSDPIYAREIGRGSLKREGSEDATVFRAELADPAVGRLAPFVRYTYWAEVRMPPERRVTGAVEARIPGGIAGVEPAQTLDCPRPFSLLSAPASVVCYPAEPPVLADDEGIAVTVEPVGVLGWAIRLRMTTTPLAHRLAIGPYRLRVWQQWGNDDIKAVPDPIDLDGGALDWSGDAHPVPPAGGATLRMALIDPLGRQGPLLARTTL